MQNGKNVAKMGVAEYCLIVKQSKLNAYEAKESFEAVLKKYNSDVNMLIEALLFADKEINRLNIEISKLKTKGATKKTSK